MENLKIGFAVIYRWRVRGEMEREFQDAWAIITQGIMATRGGLGSRLHRDGDGLWVAYAQWPSRQVWEKSQKLDSVDAAASAVMAAAIEESFAPMVLTPVADHLVVG